MRSNRDRISIFRMMICLAVVMWMAACAEKPAEPPISEETRPAESATGDAPAPSQPEHFVYDIPCEPSRVVRETVRPGQNLSEILLAYNVSHGVIHEAAQSFRKVFDPRSLKAGNPYSIICESDSRDTARYFIYEKNPVDYVVFDLADPLKVYTGSKEVQTRIREESGTIDTSLWDAFVQQELDFELALRLAEIYAWTIDFHHLQPEDHFRIIFEENHVKDQPVGPGKILAARFRHNGRDFYAFYFPQENGDGYYDETGEGMKRAFLKAPLKYTRISSRYTKKRFHPVLKQYRAHLGVDYAASHGTPIMAVGDGLVTNAQSDKYNGKYVKIKHSKTYTSQYLHMSRFHGGIKAGHRVRQGDVIGYVGATGLATGPHLCFRLWKKGKQVNPLKEDLPHSLPLEASLLPAFRKKAAALKKRLDLETPEALSAAGETAP
jgi:murein DD-endopeptidase MepM/ murein hydrolase activator NlpD